MDEPLESEIACHMKHVPNRLQCAYCIRNYQHGGECSNPDHNTDAKGCMLYKPDERGCIRKTDMVLSFALYQDVPFLNEWSDGWKYREVETEIKITWIKGITWDNKAGYLNVHCRVDYFVNEYHEDYAEPKEKPKLRIIKGRE